MAISGAIPAPGYSGSAPVAQQPGQTAGEGSGLRMAAPIFRVAQDVRKITNPYGVGLFGRGFGGYSRYGGFGGYPGGGYGGYGGYGGRGLFGSRYAGGYMSGRPGFGGALGAGLMALPSLVFKNALFAGVMSLITNAADLIGGKVDAKQFFAHAVADTAAYTGIGVSATLIGGLVGSLIPGIGTIVGIGVGIAISYFLGKAYEGQMRPGFTKSMEAKLLGTASQPLQPAQPYQPAPAWPAY